MSSPRPASKFLSATPGNGHHQLAPLPYGSQFVNKRKKGWPHEERWPTQPTVVSVVRSIDESLWSVCTMRPEGVVTQRSLPQSVADASRPSYCIATKVSKGKMRIRIYACRELRFALSLEGVNNFESIIFELFNSSPARWDEILNSVAVAMVSAWFTFEVCGWKNPSKFRTSALRTLRSKLHTSC